MTIPQSAGVPSPAPPGTTWSSAISSPAHTCGLASTISANPPRGTAPAPAPWAPGRRRRTRTSASSTPQDSRRTPITSIRASGTTTCTRCTSSPHGTRTSSPRLRQQGAGRRLHRRGQGQAVLHTEGQYRKATDRREVLHQEDHRGRIHLSVYEGTDKDSTAHKNMYLTWNVPWAEGTISAEAYDENNRLIPEGPPRATRR